MIEICPGLWGITKHHPYSIGTHNRPRITSGTVFARLYNNRPRITHRDTKAHTQEKISWEQKWKRWKENMLQSVPKQTTKHLLFWWDLEIVAKTSSLTGRGWAGTSEQGTRLQKAITVQVCCFHNSSPTLFLIDLEQQILHLQTDVKNGGFKSKAISSTLSNLHRALWDS